MTYTYAILEVSLEAYAEVRALLETAGYQHAFHSDSDGPCIDMHGIALRAKPDADMPAAERRLTELMDKAFANANHPLMLDWVAVVFELRRLRRVEALLARCLTVFEDDVDVPGTQLLGEVRAAVSRKG